MKNHRTLVTISLFMLGRLVCAEQNMICTGSQVRTRSQPSLSANVTGHLEKNQWVRVVEVSTFTSTVGGKEAPWYKVQTNGPETTWMFGGFLQEPPSNQKTVDIYPWLQMNAAELGCHFQSWIGYADPKFNCSLKTYQQPDDPCKGWFLGPDLPASYVKNIHPRATNLSIQWQGGRIRQLQISFEAGIIQEDVNRDFNLGRPLMPPYKILECKYYGQSGAVPCVNIEGFEYVGAADFDCP